MRIVPGRPKKHHESLCLRVDMLRRIFAWAILKADWIRMNRPMADPYDDVEEKERRSEYSKLLENLPYSELQGRCDPADSSGYPAQILKWQYEDGLLARAIPADQSDVANLLFSKGGERVAEEQCEYARRLALFLVAKEAKMSIEYLRKICRKWDPKTADSDQGFGVDPTNKE